MTDKYPCVWTEAYEGNGPWEVGCGHDFELDGTPSENGMKFCCFCGAELQEERWTEEPEEEES